MPTQEYPGPLEGFTAGTSLCFTSLGTTFVVLASAFSHKHKDESDLNFHSVDWSQTRAGTVLVSAALFDGIGSLGSCCPQSARHLQPQWTAPRMDHWSASLS